MSFGTTARRARGRAVDAGRGGDGHRDRPPAHDARRLAARPGRFARQGSLDGQGPRLRDAAQGRRHGHPALRRPRLLEGHPLEWMYRYARQARLVDGATEVHKMVLATSSSGRAQSFPLARDEQPAAGVSVRGGPLAAVLHGAAVRRCLRQGDAVAMFHVIDCGLHIVDQRTRPDALGPQAAQHPPRPWARCRCPPAAVHQDALGVD